MTTEERLRAAIAAAPDDAEPFLVYADFLQQRGDPIGELIMVMCERERERSDDERLLRRQEEILLRSSRALLGGLSKHGQYVELAWQRGFIRDAKLINREQSPSRSRLARLVTLLAEAPAALILDELTLVAPDLTILQEAITALEASTLPRLARLAFQSSRPREWDERAWDYPSYFDIDPNEPCEPSDWPAPRYPLTLDFIECVPRRLPALVAEADAITVRGVGDDSLAAGLAAIAQRRAGAPVRLEIVRPTLRAITFLTTGALRLEGLALADASRDSLRELADCVAAFPRPALGIAVRPRDCDPATRAALEPLQIEWLS